MCIESERASDKAISPATADVIFQTLTGRWVLQILVALSSRELRFTSLRREIPKVSANVLTTRLRELEAVLACHGIFIQP